jgi:hypothetical protein
VRPDRLDVALLVEGLRRDLLLARRNRNGVEEDALEVGILVVRQHPKGGAHVPDVNGQARVQPRLQFLQDPGAPNHLALTPAQHDLVAARHDSEGQLGLEQAQVLVVSTQQGPEVDLGRERDALGGGLSHAVEPVPPSHLFATTRVG